MEDLKIKIKKLEASIASASTPDNFKAKMKEQLAKLNEDLLAKEAEASAKEDMKKEKEPKKTEPSKPTVKVVAKAKKAEPKAPEKKAEPSKPKRVKDAEKSEEPSCDDLLARYRKQRENSKKAGKRYKKTSVAEKIGDNIASAVSKAIHNIPLTEIKENPKDYIKKFERVEKYVSDFSNGLKSILGDDFDKDELMKPFEEVIGKFITQIKKKYA